MDTSAASTSAASPPETSGQAATAVPEVSVVIPVYNGAHTMDVVLAALYESTFKSFEVVVVNDCSPDNTLEVLKELAPCYPHRLVDFKENLGVSKARNAGAKAARGEIIFFIDADCIVLPDTIERSIERLRQGDSICVGGAYTTDPYDSDFFSTFQSLYIHHVETKIEFPDYIATHCMAIAKQTFEDFGGFIEDSFIGHAASVEDVELSHRLIRAGYRLTRPSDILVRHMFGYNFKKSVKNALKKSKYWTMYSLKNRDVMKDSGAASYELKTDVATQALNAVLLVALIATRKPWLLAPMVLLYGVNLLVSRKLLALILREQGWWFLLRATAYYQFIYPFVVAYGSLLGTWKYLWEVKLLRRFA